MKDLKFHSSFAKSCLNFSSYYKIIIIGDKFGGNKQMTQISSNILPHLHLLQIGFTTHIIFILSSVDTAM